MERNACAAIEDARLDRRLYRPHEASAVRIAHRARRIARGLRANRSMGNAGCVRWIQRANAGIGTACRRAPWPLRPRTRQTVRLAESETAGLPVRTDPWVSTRHDGARGRCGRRRLPRASSRDAFRLAGLCGPRHGSAPIETLPCERHDAMMRWGCIGAAPSGIAVLAAIPDITPRKRARRRCA